MRRTQRLLLTIPFLAVVACGGGSDRGAGAGDSAGKPLSAGGERVAEGERGAVAGAKAGGGAPQKNALALAREVIRTGSITVTVADLDAARRNALALAEDAGGFLEGEQGRMEVGTVLTLRVPPKRFTATTDAIARLGKVEERTVETEDVTGDVADVQGRLAAARASVERVRRLLAQASTISEIREVEEELNTRESELEALQARHRALSEQTGMAKITATLNRTSAPAAQPKEDDPNSFASGLSAGWDAFVFVTRVLLVVIGVLLPFALAGAVVVVPIVLWVRRRRPSHAG